MSKGNNFIERSITGALEFFKEAVCSEETARSAGFLQRLGPKLKITFVLLFVLAACFARNLALLAVLYAISIALAALSGINILFFLKRVWVFIPIFTLVVAIPAVFMHGLYPAAVFVLRVGTCVSFVVLAAITTRHSELLKSLRSLGVPQVFVSVLDMTYRYIFLFVKAFEEMHLSLKSRLVERMAPAEGRRWVASRISALFRRSLKMSEEVYMAMVARGYDIGDKKHE